MTPPTLASGGRARRTFQFSDLVGPHFFAPNQATHTQAPSENFMDFLSDKPGDRFNPRQSILPGARAPREPLAPGRQGTSGPWAAGNLWPLVICRIPPVGHLTDLPGNPRPPVAIPGELEGIPGEVSGWNGSELNSERIHVRFSRNRRWNSGGWHRPGKAESGGFSRCRGPPDFFRAAARGSVGKRANP